MKQQDIIYCRVSTEQQSKDGKTSIPEQEASCKEFLAKLDYNDTVVFHEDFSGYEYDRPKLNEIKELVEQGKVRSLTALRVDRISRKTGHLDMLRDNFFIPYDLEVYTIDDLGRWYWEENSIMMQNLFVNFSEFWGRIAVRLMKNGKIGKVKAGNTLAFGHPPYGYVEVKEESKTYFQIEPVEASIIETLYQMYVEDDMSLAAIARRLNFEQVPTYCDIRGNHFRRKAEEKHIQSVWYGSTVRQMITNRTYLGEWQYTPKKGKPILVSVPPIVDEDTFQLAEKKLSYNKRNKSGRETKYPILMARRMTCACGLKMTVVTKKQGRYKYFRCPGSLRNGEVKRSECPKPYLRSELVDNLAFNWLYDLLSDKGKLRDKIDNFLAEQEKQASPFKDKLSAIDKTLGKKSREHEAKYQSFWQLPETFKARAITDMEKLESEIQELETEYDEISKELEKLGAMADSMKWYVEATKDDSKFFPVVLSKDFDYDKADELLQEDDLSFEDKLAYAEQFNLQGQIVVEDNIFKLRVSCNLDVSGLLELCEGSKAYTEYKPQYIWSFSDILLLDFQKVTV